MKRKLAVLLALLFMLVLLGADFLFLRHRTDPNSPAAQLSPKHPQMLTVWHYYNGTHQQAFDRLVLAFNETVGQELGIIIEAKSQGSVGGLTKALLASARGDFGADPMPDLFAAYSDMAWDVSKIRPLADLSAYFTPAELAAYIPAYIEEGHLAGSASLSVFPVAKSTEVLMFNRTEWYLFSAATEADASLLSTWEGIRELSRQYYEWTDSLTPDMPDDGRAFFGLDSAANFAIISSQQLGVEMFHVADGQVTLTLDEGVMRKLWEHFVVPYVNGWYASYGAYRTDDVKTGRLVALVGSTSGAVYFPSVATRTDGTTYPIVGECLPLPVYEGAQPYAVQQGAGMAVTASTPVREYAASVFLKWFTQEANNIDFSIASGYLPVKTAANSLPRLKQTMQNAGIPDMLQDSLLTSAEMTGTYRLYTTHAFDNCYQVRQALENGLYQAARDGLERRNELMASGMSRQDAIAQLTDDVAFSTWLAGFRTTMAQTLE